MNDKYCVVVYPHDIKFIDESGTISYYVDRKVSDYVKELQDKLSKVESENRQKDIDKLQLQSNWNSLRELIIKRLDKYDRLVSKEEGIEIEILMWVRDKMNKLEGKDKD